MHSFIQKFVCLALGLGLWVSAGAQASEKQAKSAQGASKITLKVGTKAPELKADAWYKGEPLKSYDSKKFYVIEVWATWCGPCILAMPHLNELAEKYADDGFEVVALTAADPSNTKKAVEKFVEGRGKDYKFRYAFCEDRSTYDSFMTAAGMNSIPCSFVVDRNGKIAYVGLPNNLDFVLSRIASGTWRGQADLDELAEIGEAIKSLSNVMATDPEKALEIIARVEQVNPDRANALDVTASKVSVLTQVKRFVEAKRAIQTLKPVFKKSNDWGGLALVASGLASSENNPEGVEREFALKVMQACEESAKEDFEGLVKVAMAYRVSGDIELFTQCMKKAIEKAENPALKAMLEANLKSVSGAPGT